MRSSREFALKVRTVGRRVAQAAHRAVREFRRWWESHWTRIAQDHGYAEAFTAVVVAVAVFVVHEATAAYVAVLRALRPHPGEDGAP